MMNAELEKLLLLKGRPQPPAVLLAAAECAPLSKTGGLADVVGALPAALGELGFDARVITPYHRCIKERYAGQVEHLAHIYVDLGWRHQYAGLERLCLPGLTVYLVDSEYYFGDRIYRGGQAEVEQYAFFQRAVLELLPMLPDFAPEVLHCNDWHTAMLPFLLKTQYQHRPQGRLKTILTIHNIAFQGWCPLDTAGDLLGVEPRWFSLDGILHGDCANFLKAGCLFADRVNTVSPSYAGEIRTPAFGEGLQEVLLCRGSDVSGILNGLDIRSYDPAGDPNLVCNYDRSCWAEKKRENKIALLSELGLDRTGPDTPLIAMVTRMTAQKGFDLVLRAMDAIMEQGASFVLLGTGDAGYEHAMEELARRYPGRIQAVLAYNEALSRRIYAGADYLLMPSAFEPCGLSQMIAMRYGTLPIVHEVGGLRDTVRPYNRYTGEGNGFSFYDFNCGTLLGTVAYALSVYHDPAVRAALVDSAMGTDVSFAASAVEYGKLYLSLVEPAGVTPQHRPEREEFRRPFGALQCGQTVHLRLYTAGHAGEAALLVNGETIPMAPEGPDHLAVDYTVPAQPGLVEYRFLLSGSVILGQNGLGCGEMQPWTITVYDPDFATPAWAEGAVMYQIFPDRFAPGGHAAASGAAYHRRLGRTIQMHKSWDEPVKYLPDPGEADYYPNDFYGGTLRGITKHLPQLRALGVDCLYLNPIFESDSNHRYNTADYGRVDPMLGSQEDLQALFTAAAELGIRVLLDGVFSHTGDDSVYFNKYGRYPDLGAYQSEASPYARWYSFQSFPEQYRCWWGFPSLPEVDENDPGWQNYVIRGKDAILRRWLRQGAAGWRLDVADELPDAVIARMRRAVKQEQADALLLGEVWEDATTKISYGARRDYALGRGLDSVMNYPLREAVLRFALGQLDAGGLAAFLTQQRLNYPLPMYRCLMNHLGTHDTARLRTVLGSGSDGAGLSRTEQAAFRLSPEQDARGGALQRLCAAIQFALPGMPCVYYGDEEGMQGFRDPFCRAPYRRQDKALRQYYAGLAAQRKDSPALTQGDAAFAACDPDTLCILRYTGAEAALVAVNRGSAPAELQPALADLTPLRAEDAARLGALPALQVPPCGSALARWETL